MDEREAIARCQQGDIRGLESLVRIYELSAVRAAYLIVGERALAEDVVQEAFLHAYAQIHQFDPARPFGPWFLQSVVHRALRTVKRSRRSRAWDATTDAARDQVSDSTADPIAQLLVAETSAAIWATVGQLPPDQRAAIVLRYYLDLNEAEMADRLACPPGTIKSRLYTARRHLRRLLPTWIRDPGADPDPIHVRPVRRPVVTKEDQP
ncbi:MAG TPA: RNA polymerase sigma factor [Chloroflexia bacterium]|nr:RNA polymerase sigma factor [Chloroflexia bacterium]